MVIVESIIRELLNVDVYNILIEYQVLRGRDSIVILTKFKKKMVICHLRNIQKHDQIDV